MSETLIIFSRYPQAGKTKTRMIPALGAEGAAILQQEMTEHTINTARKLKRSRDSLSIEIHFNGGNHQLMTNWLGSDFNYYSQVDGDLGQKMRSALARAFRNGSNSVVIIGIDCPDLDKTTLSEAFVALESTDTRPIHLVLGKAQDGGYYSIGLSNHSYLSCEWQYLFDNIDWGTDRVFRQTINIANRLNFNTHYLPTLRDVDRPEDLEVWRSHFSKFSSYSSEDNQ